MEPRQAKSILILGGAKCVFDDWQRAIQNFRFDAFMAINDVGMEIPEIDYWVSMHPNKMPAWLEVRRRNGFSDPKSFWTAKDREIPKELEFQTIQNTRGGSGLLAIYVARRLGYDSKVLAGVPMLPSEQHYHKEGLWKECNLYRIVWERNPTLKEDVRSMSGWTRDQFGEPDKTWLNTPFDN